MTFLDRSKQILTENGLEKLKSSHVAVFGIGGVGGNAAEALVRSGIGEITVIDGDIVDITNINRQVFATAENIGEDKVEAAAKRLLSINSSLIIHTKKVFFLEESKEEIDFRTFDYILDCVDTVTAKLLLVKTAKDNSIPIISAMGAGNKKDPTAFTVDDIFSTSICPLAKVMRKELKALKIDSLKVVYSKEPPALNVRPPQSLSFVPPVMGLIMAGEVIKDLTN